MDYEIDFIGVPDDKKDSQAVCLRYRNKEGRYTTIVYDAGFTSGGEEMCAHLKRYYFNGERPRIDYLFCSHSHDDHIGGVVHLIENCDVKRIFFNAPWDCIDELYNRITDRRKTRTSLDRRLREEYSGLESIEKLAADRGIPRFNSFVGSTVVPDVVSVLSPTRDFYIEQTCRENVDIFDAHGKQGSASSSMMLSKVREDWDTELLRENVSTSAENETSLVLDLDFENERVLLTGDAGPLALSKAIENSEDMFSSDIKDVTVYQMPHHGSRHNVTPSILDRLVGPILEKESAAKQTEKVAFACTAATSDHPKGMVTNAFIRRGCNVYATNGFTICHSYGSMPSRDGWSAIKKIDFAELVDPWDS